MILIGIAGGTGSGKTTFVNRLIEQLKDDSIPVIPQDAYYCNNVHIDLEERKQLNYDHPQSIEWQLMIEQLTALKNGESIQRPLYSMLSCSRQFETVEVHANKVVIVEGILILTHPPLLNLLNLKIFIDADADHRLMRVVKRDMEQRGRNVEEVMQRYLKTVRPMHDQFIEPSKKHADIIVPIGGDNHVAIELLAQYIGLKLKQQST